MVILALGLWDVNSDETPFPVRDTERGPSWVEKQRVLRAFWRIQLFGDLEAPRPIYPQRFKAGIRLIYSVNTPCLTPLHDLIPDNEHVIEPYHWQQDGIFEQELICTVLFYVQNNQERIKTLSFEKTVGGCPPFSGSSED